MVKKNDTIKNINNNDNKKSIIGKLFNNIKKSPKTNSIETPEQIVKDVEEQLKVLHSKINLKDIIKIDSQKDLAKKKKDKFVKKIYPYWVYIVKDGKKIKDFGVREEDLNGIKLLIRTEKINDEVKVVFRELYPESKYDPNTIDSNKKRLSKELNTLKQIEKELEAEIFDKGETFEYNYELADVKILILEKTVMLDTIKYGKSFRYFHDWVRDDGIPALVYEFENNGLRLKKEVKERSLFTEASEVKQIESLETKRDIDEQLKKKDERDWKKIAYAFLWAFLLLIGTYGVFQLLNYNEERENGDLMNKIEAMQVSCDSTYNKVTNSLVNNNKPFLDALTNTANSNNDLIEQCIKSNLIEGGKPTIKE